MILLARHGNSFAPGDPVVWVGARSDPPLAAEGERQAERLVAWMKTRGMVPGSVVAGPLARTRMFAGIVAAAFGRPLAIDEDLVELDYGAWEGLDEAAIVARGDGAALDGWTRSLAWPAAFGGSLEAVERRLARVLDRARGATAPFVCTSNGILRLLRRMIDPAGDPARGKVRTGALCVVAADGAGWRIETWDERPEDAR